MRQRPRLARVARGKGDRHKVSFRLPNLLIVWAGTARGKRRLRQMWPEGPFAA